MVCIEAPAKINLHLEIRGKRTDGYHNIESIFQKVSLSDTLNVSSLKTKKICTITGNFDFPARNNIISKAYEVFSSITGIGDGIEVSVEKRIPMGAGLGGGSSDAAAMIRALEALHNVKLTRDELENCALHLGSDVLFFLGSPVAAVTGRGDIIRPLLPRCDYELFIIFPGFGIVTKTAYALLDETRARIETAIRAPTIDDMIRIYNEKPISEWKFNNSFTDVLRSDYPLLNIIIERLKSFGASYANITGSGSAVIAVFRKGEVSLSRLDTLRKDYPFVFYVKPLDKDPLSVLQ